jgi:two-component system chemotaxis response regulator CheB
MSPAREVKVKVLVIDDSAYNRQTLTQMLESEPGIRVVARAGDGDEGLRQVFAHQPDVITLDVEMPKMDGFTFLRILMSKRPTPVLVVSSHARRDQVFKALELGALDFIAKPTQRISPELREIERDLVSKVKLIAQLRVVPIGERLPRRRDSMPPGSTAAGTVPPGVGLGVFGSGEAGGGAVAPSSSSGLRVVLIGASTGGPPALQQIVQSLPPPTLLPMALIVAQHMPAKFTTAFADRLGRTSPWPFREARAGDVLVPGTGLVAPGGAITTLARAADGTLRVEVTAPGATDHFMPSIDRLFSSAAELVGDRLLCLVLTGMGGDGARGVRAVKAQGGHVIAESAETAVIFGMPDEAIKTGAVEEVLPLPEMARAIARFGGL